MVKDRVKGALPRHVPLSRLRYEQSHPCIAIRVPREVYDALVEIRKRTGQSWADLMKVALKLQEPILEPRQPDPQELAKAERRGKVAGIAETVARYRVLYSCSECEKPMDLTSDAEKRAAARYMQEHGWHHGRCPTD